MHKNQEGFIRIFTLLILIGLVLAGRYAWQQYHKVYVKPADASKIPAQPHVQLNPKSY